MQTTKKETTNNQVVISGVVISEKFEYSHEVFGEKFYRFELATKRKSGNEDIIPIMISERFPEFEEIKKDMRVRIDGQLRSYNKYVEGKAKLILDVFTQEITFMSEEEIDDEDLNSIVLHGFICKDVIYRKTPLGKEIADILLAVNREYNKSDYIPCIVWGRNAAWISTYEVGTEVRIIGRIQSRKYYKKISEENVEERTAYEVSVAKLEIM